jgi:hypothetical protein
MSDIDHPTPVQGEALPVVAYRKPKHGGGDDYKSAYYAIGTDFIHGAFALTDHAQATAEIARLTEENRKLRVNALQNKICMNASVEERDRITVDNNALRTQLSDTTKLREALEKIACESQTDGLLWWQLEARAALNSTAQK